MRRKVNLLVLLCIFWIAAGSSALAAEMDMQVTMDADTGLVHGIISLSEPEENKIITVEVLDPEKNYNYLAQLYTDANGTAEFSYYNKGGLGEYTVTAYADAWKIGKTILCQFAGKETLQEICDAAAAELAKAEPSGSVLEAILDENLGYFNLIDAHYEAIKDKSDIYHKIAAEETNRGIDVTVQNIGLIFSKGLVVAEQNQSHSADFVKSLWEETLYPGLFVAEEVFPKIEGKPVTEAMTDAQQMQFYTAAANQDYTSYTDFLDEMRLQALLVSVQKATAWQDALAALNAYEEAGFLSLEKTKYAKLKQPERVIKDIMSSTFLSYAELSEKFRQSAEKWYSQEYAGSSPSGTGTGGGGGGGGGRGSSALGNQIYIDHSQLEQPQQSAQPSNGQEQEEQGFTDMEDAKWAIQAVNELKKRKIIDGDPDGRFRPNDYITRAEAAKLFTAFADADVQEKSIFSDVTPDAWYTEYVYCAADCGIMRGYPDGTFMPDAWITRAEAAVAAQNLMQYAQFAVQPGTYTEYDDAVPDWAAEAILFLRSVNVMVGRSDNMFVPDEKLTRAEAARLIYNIIIAAGL